MKTMITKQGYENIVNELNKLIHVDRPIVCKMLEESRPVGVVEDEPEFMQALENQDRIEKRILDLKEILDNSIIFDKSMCALDKVSFGATIKFINCDTDEIKSYTIVSIYESDINKGLISIEAPFIKNILGFRTGDFFDFNNVEYQIIDINYVL